jgi:hypothetical protein
MAFKHVCMFVYFNGTRESGAFSLREMAILPVGEADKHYLPQVFRFDNDFKGYRVADIVKRFHYQFSCVNRSYVGVFGYEAKRFISCLGYDVEDMKKFGLSSLSWLSKESDERFECGWHDVDDEICSAVCVIRLFEFWKTLKLENDDGWTV